MGDMFAQPVAARLRGIGAEYGSDASNMCRDERLDIRAAITNAATDSDEWTAAPVGAFAVERAQAAPEDSSRFRRRQKDVWTIDVHSGLACQRHSKPGVARQFMTGLFLQNVQINRGLRFGLCTPPSVKCCTDSVVRDPPRQARTDNVRCKGHKL
jgi:hypothetical protein